MPTIDLDVAGDDRSPREILDPPARPMPVLLAETPFSDEPRERVVQPVDVAMAYELAGVADDGGFGFAIAKALGEAGATVMVGTWPSALNIFHNLLERGKMDESRRLSDGSLRHREDVVEGLENAPEALIGLLKGKNFGKLLVKVGADPTR